MTFAIVVTLLLSTGATETWVADEAFADLSSCVQARERIVAEIVQTYNARDWDGKVIDALPRCAMVHRGGIK